MTLYLITLLVAFSVTTTSNAFIATTTSPPSALLNSGLPVNQNCHKTITRRTSLSASLSTIEPVKQNLIDVAERIRSDDGIIVKDSDAQDELKKAVSQLEAVSDPPSKDDYDKHFEGDWTLVCTTVTTESPLKNVELPFGLPNLLNEGPIANIRESINKRLTVKQVIKSDAERIDHVLEIEPADKIQDLVGDTIDIPDTLSTLNLNPLEVTDTKVTLIHKADVQSVTPVLRTKLSLTSIVLTVAGKSTNLDPDGADVLGINLPLGEFLNYGTFDTTYMDESLRISRGKNGIVDQLRVFVRTGTTSDDLTEEEEKVETEEVEDVVILEKEDDEEVVASAEEASSPEEKEEDAVDDETEQDDNEDEDAVEEEEESDSSSTDESDDAEEGKETDE